MQARKKRPVRAAWSLEVSSEIQGLPPGKGQADRRSGAGDYSGRQASGGKGVNHWTSRNRVAGAMEGPGQAGHHRCAREERGGDGEDDGFTHVRWP